MSTRLSDHCGKPPHDLFDLAPESFPILPDDFPEVIVLLGSSRFKDTFQKEGHKLELQGKLVLMMAFFQHADSVPVTDEQREVINRVDDARLDLADRAFVINLKQAWCPACDKWAGGALMASWTEDTQDHRCYLHEPCRSRCVFKPYVGEHTAREIAYALKIGVPVTYLNPMEEAPDATQTT